MKSGRACDKSCSRAFRFGFPALVILCGILAFALAGCGGGGKSGGLSTVPAASNAGKGRATLTFRWPVRSVQSRLFPVLSNSLEIEVLRGTTVIDTKLIPRPDDTSVPTTVSYDNLPVDTLTLRASTYPNADGTGTAQARGTISFTVAADDVTDFGTLTMDTTIDTVAVSSPDGSSATLAAGGAAQQWTAVAKSGSAIVLVSPDKQKWESSNPAVATVSSTGLVTPVAVGNATIKETDQESGKSGSKDIAVVNPTVVTVSQLPVLTKYVQVLVYKKATINTTAAYPFQYVSGGTQVIGTTVARANGEANVTAQLGGLTNGTYQVQALAYNTANTSGVPSGVPMGRQATELTISGGTVSLDLPLVSTVSSVTITPSDSNAEVVHGQTVSLTQTTAKQSDGSIVPTDPSEFSWSSSNPAVATVGAQTGSSTTVTMLTGGSVSITATHVPSGKTNANTYNVVGAIKPQFKPADYALPGGSLALTDGHTYQFDTSAADAPTLTDTTSGTLIATGQYVTQTIGANTAAYAVFAFAGDFHIGGATTVSAKGAAPLVLLTQSNLLLDGGALLDVSAAGAMPGTGGSAPGHGKGVGKWTQFALRGDMEPIYIPAYGGGGFGGLGGTSSSVYGTDLAGEPTPYLQGGSGGYTSGTTGGAGGGALYLAAQGTLRISGGAIKARGGNGAEGGSGGALVLLGGSGGVIFSQATLDAGGGKYSGSNNHGGGGGGRIVIGYGTGASPDLSLVTAAGGLGNGRTVSSGNGQTGKIYVESFGGF